MDVLIRDHLDALEKKGFRMVGYEEDYPIVDEVVRCRVTVVLEDVRSKGRKVKGRVR